MNERGFFKDPQPHILDMAQRALDLPPHVEARKQTLVEEVLTLCKKYGFSHPKDLATSPDTSHIPLFDLQLLADLMSKLEYIVKHRELPPEEEPRELVDDREYTMELPEDSIIAEVFDDRGRPIVTGFNKEYGFVMDHTGIVQSIEEAEELSLAVGEREPKLIIKTWQGIYQICDLNLSSTRGDKKEVYVLIFKDAEHRIDHVFLEDRNGKLKCYPMDREGKLIGRSQGYKTARQPVAIGENTYFVANEEGSLRSCVYNEQGEQINEEEYEAIDYLFVLEGRLVLQVQKNSHHFFVYPDGTLLEDEPKNGFEGPIRFPKVLDGKIHFWRKVFSPFSRDAYFFTDHTGETFGKKMTDFTPTDWKMLGQDLFFWESWEIAQSLKWIRHMNVLGDTRRLCFGPVLPIRIGESVISIGNFPDGMRMVINRKISSDASFEQVYTCEALDDHRFYVIAQEEGKIVKRVFTV